MAKRKLDDGKTEIDTIGHNGGIHGFSSVLVRVPAKKELVVLLDNTSRGDKLGPLSSGILSILHDVEPKQPRKSIVEALQPTIEKSNGAAIVAKYRELLNQKPAEYEADEGQLNALGYRLLSQGRTDDAIAAFQLNVELNPKSANVYDSLGEAYAAKGDKPLAIQNYKKSHELDPKNQNALDAIARLEKPPTNVDTKYPLETFVGKYQLAPNFILSFFLEEGKLHRPGKDRHESRLPHRVLPHRSPRPPRLRSRRRRQSHRRHVVPGREGDEGKPHRVVTARGPGSSGTTRPRRRRRLPHPHSSTSGQRRVEPELGLF